MVILTRASLLAQCIVSSSFGRKDSAAAGPSDKKMKAISIFSRIQSSVVRPRIPHWPVTKQQCKDAKQYNGKSILRIGNIMCAYGLASYGVVVLACLGRDVGSIGYVEKYKVAVGNEKRTKERSSEQKKNKKMMEVIGHWSLAHHRTCVVVHNYKSQSPNQSCQLKCPPIWSSVREHHNLKTF